MLTARRFQMKKNRRKEEEIMMELRALPFNHRLVEPPNTQVSLAIIVNCVRSVCL
jgi:hypothetical protein